MIQFNIHRILVLAGMIAIIAGSIYAITQNEIKRRLVFTVAQVGYIFMGLGLMNTTGLTYLIFI